MDVGRINLSTASGAASFIDRTIPAIPVGRTISADELFDPMSFVSKPPPTEPSPAIEKATQTAEKLLDVLAEIAEYPNSAAQTQAIAAALNAITAFLSVQRR